MANPAPLCTHVKTDGTTCGSPAVKGTDLCYHHSAMKAALGKGQQQARHGQYEPIPFVFVEDRASLQINFFLLLQAFNEGRVDLSTYRAMLNILKAMKTNLGKTGSLVDEARDQESGTRDQKNEELVTSKPTSQKRDVGHPQCATGAANAGPIEFSPELMAEFEEIERLDTNDPSYSARIRAAVAEGARELKAQGLA